MIRVLVVDDHSVVREGVKRILADTADMCVAGEASNGQEALAKVAAQAWNVVLLDISLPGRSGLEVLHLLKHTHPRLPVLVFSMHPGSQYAMRALKVGAAGYLTKESLPGELVTALRKIARGGRYVSSALTEQLLFEITRKDSAPLHERLSDREYQVLCLLASGKTVTAVADELALSVKTISTYRTRILAKLHLKTTAELIHYAIHHHLLID
jgi:two-component system invasion response regulator UvrY